MGFHVLCRKRLHLFLEVSMLSYPYALIFQKPASKQVLPKNICCTTFTQFSHLMHCWLPPGSMLIIFKMINPYSSGGTWFQWAYEIIVSQKWKYYLKMTYWKTKQTSLKWEAISASSQSESLYGTKQNPQLPKQLWSSWQHGRCHQNTIMLIKHDSG